MKSAIKPLPFALNDANFLARLRAAVMGGRIVTTEHAVKRMREISMKPYHYTESGLRNVWLLSGFEWMDTGYGKGIMIHDLPGLHESIGRSLAKKSHITGAELRFLRKELDLSQRGLGELLGVTDQAVAKWEKIGRLPKTADRMIRLIYIEHLDGNVKIRKTIEGISETDREQNDRLEFSETDAGWRIAA